jgi:hypothetical protein
MSQVNFSKCHFEDADLREAGAAQLNLCGADLFSAFGSSFDYTIKAFSEDAVKHHYFYHDVLSFERLFRRATADHETIWPEGTAGVLQRLKEIHSVQAAAPADVERESEE